MDKLEFIKRLKDSNELADDSQDEWDTLVAKFPFSPLVQFAAAKHKKTLSEREIESLAMYQVHPLQFSNFVSTISIISSAEDAISGDMDILTSTSNSTVDGQKTEAMDSVSTEILEVLEEKREVVEADIEYRTQATKEESTDGPINLELKKEDDEKQMTSTESIKPDEIELIERTETPLIAPPLDLKEEEVLSEVIEEEKDILTIIQELPEESPIGLKNAFELKEQTEEKVEIAETTTTHPKDLMVMMSFMDWLKYYKTKNEDEKEDEKGRKAIKAAWQKEKLAEAMDDDEDEVPEEIFKQAMDSISFGPALMSEPLAELFAKQGKIEKAIEMYKKLSLQNPEKRAYFATKIKELHLSN